MRVVGRQITSLSALAALGVLLSGCPFDFQKETRPNSPPFTFFDGSPADTTFDKNVNFRWLGTDLDSDVVAYQFQLVSTDAEFFFSGGQFGNVLSSINPLSPSPEENWSPRGTDNRQGFIDLEDGYYEMRARSIDDTGQFSAPAKHRFFLKFDDIVPQVTVLRANGETEFTCGRVLVAGSPQTFYFTATDESRSGTTPRSELQYRYTLRGRSANTCTTHLADRASEWEFFPDDSQTPQIGPTYNDLLDGACGWDFRVEVRDPAGRIGAAVCCVTQTTGCR
ncbi:MAG: hypothetical protein DHS20C21_14430 [Gemmatimonadota bacterium]|nr:MAG: hypothetical protein DHS20C21_14430 [Gemmatimonadota bacterium]